MRPMWAIRAHVGTPPGTWSDNGATAFALLDSLLTCGRFDANDLGARLLARRDQGPYAVDARVFDIGIQTDRALSAIAQGPQRWRQDG
jgi:ADP-ribosylglycohydrolase